jgi:CubicO group peptidase (beta-lactamase class C family)
VDAVGESIDRLCAETGFSGVVRVDHASTVFVKAYGFADRRHAIRNTIDGQFGIASGTKGVTALTVVSLIEEGHLDFSTTARSVLGGDLPMIDDDVTVGQLLAHRSGIGDYLDEGAGHTVTDYVLTVPVHQLRTTEDYLQVLDGHPAAFAAGGGFAYSNSGYVVLALMAERISGTPFPELVERKVCSRAGMHDTAFLRSDELPGRAAVGYLSEDGVRTNVLHLPVIGSGDGGIYSTAADVHALWDAFFGGRVVSKEMADEMVRPRSAMASPARRYGLGFWLHESNDSVVLEGYDAGVSFRTVHSRAAGFTHTVISNTSSGAWPVTRRLDELLMP